MEVQEEEEVLEQVPPVGMPRFSDLLTRVSGGWNGGGLGTGNSSSVSRLKETTDPGFQGSGIEDLYADDEVIRHSLHHSCEVNNEFF